MMGFIAILAVGVDEADIRVRVQRCTMTTFLS
jgi:hypothetical protein